MGGREGAGRLEEGKVGIQIRIGAADGVGEEEGEQKEAREGERRLEQDGEDRRWHHASCRRIAGNRPIVVLKLGTRCYGECINTDGGFP